MVCRGHDLDQPISFQLRHPEEWGLFAIMLQTFRVGYKSLVGTATKQPQSTKRPLGLHPRTELQHPTPLLACGVHLAR